ncbi:MAG: DASS family sodium-coupled anion symporter, partial [Flavobacteriales bacterium]
FLFRPFPTGLSVLLGLLVLVIFGTVNLGAVLEGYADTVVWLVVSAFFIASGVINTGLGKRIALNLVMKFGNSMPGLGYAICATELILGPVIPSNTARGGGVVAPIMRSISTAMGSYPSDSPKKAGEYLTLVGAHANLIAAAMFMTGMAANPLISEYAGKIMETEFSWTDWALGAIVPGIVSMAFLPKLLSKISPPKLKDTTAARFEAKKELDNMGRMSINEKLTLTVFILLILFWALSFLHGLSTTVVALCGVIAMLLTSVLKWEDIISNKGAWDTFIWLGGLLTITSLLKDHGFIEWAKENLEASLSGWEGMTILLILGLIYFYSMYFFSMLTAHITALVPAFFGFCIAGEVPVMAAIILIAVFSNLCGCTTNYSTGPLIIYFGIGYIEPKKWFLIGFLVSIFHLFIWFTVGLGWWKVLGWW